MLTLFMGRTCPFSKKVIEVAEELGVPLVLRDVADPEVEAELVRLGGQMQTPYLVDPEHDVAMYNSDDIIPYLHQTFGKT